MNQEGFSTMKNMEFSNLTSQRLHIFIVMRVSTVAPLGQAPGPQAPRPQSPKAPRPLLQCFLPELSVNR